MDYMEQTRRMRVDSCLMVIHDVSRRLTQEGAPHKIVEQLQRLDDLLSVIDHEAVTDSDLERIEGSTNQLMRELGVLFSHQDLGALYDVSFH